MNILKIFQIIILISIILLCMISCVKTIYVGDEEAIRYRILYEESHEHEIDCRKDLDICIKICDDIGSSLPLP